MTFYLNKQRIEIRQCYNWYDVYVNNIMILHHINQQQAKDIENAIIAEMGNNSSK